MDEEALKRIGRRSPRAEAILRDFAEQRRREARRKRIKGWIIGLMVLGVLGWLEVESFKHPQEVPAGCQVIDDRYMGEQVIC